MAFVKAKRSGQWAKILLDGPSGSGKTWSALLLATGLAKREGSRIAAIDTENGRMNYYADKFDFDTFDMSEFREDERYKPENYKYAIEQAVLAGYKVIVIDSMSHEWKYLNDVHDRMTGNSFTNWQPLKKRHNDFFEYVLQSPIHIIATARAKDEYVMETGTNGKQQPRKVGLGAIQDKEIEYNYTVTFNLAQDSHIATATKDNTHLFEGRFLPITEKNGEEIYEWANSGEAIKPSAPAPTFTKPSAAEPVTDDIQDLKKRIVTKASALVKKDKEKTMTLVKKYESSGNPNKITDVAVAKELLEELNNLEFNLI